MSRSAQDVLEFDKLRELLRARTDVRARPSPHRRARARQPIAPRSTHHSPSSAKPANGSAPAANSVSVASPIRKRGSIASKASAPRSSRANSSMPHRCSTPPPGCKPQFKEDAAKFPLLAARAASVADLRDLSAAIRRAVLPNGEISDDASPELRRIRGSIGAHARHDSENARAHSARARRRRRRRLRHAAQRPLRHSRARRRPPPGARRRARRERHGPNRFRRAVRNHRAQQPLVQLAEDEAAEIARILRSSPSACGQIARRLSPRGRDDRGTRLARSRVRASPRNSTAPLPNSSPNRHELRARTPRAIPCSPTHCARKAAPSSR